MEQFHETMAGATVTRMPVGPLLTNCYLVQSGTELMLVDPGMVWNRELEEVATVVESANAHLRWIVCTLSLIHISEPTRLGMISYAVFCLKKKKEKITQNHIKKKQKIKKIKYSKKK